MAFFWKFIEDELRWIKIIEFYWIFIKNIIMIFRNEDI